MPYPRELPERPVKFNYGFLRQTYAVVIAVGAGFACLAHALGKVEDKIPPKDPRDPRVILREAENPIKHGVDLPTSFMMGSSMSSKRMAVEKKERELHPGLREEMAKAESLEKGEHKQFVYTKAPLKKETDRGQERVTM